MSQHRSWVFKTPHLAGTNHRDDDYTPRRCLPGHDGGAGLSLAGGDRSRQWRRRGGCNVFVDGGLWANNPVLVGLVDALDMAAPDQPIEIFCLGTCPLPAGEQIARNDVHRGLAGWKFGGDAAALSIDAQEFAYDHMARKLARHLNRPCEVSAFPATRCLRR